MASKETVADRAAKIEILQKRETFYFHALTIIVDFLSVEVVEVVEVVDQVVHLV